MEYFLQGHDYMIWSIVEEGDLLVTNAKAQWTDEDRRKISLNFKAKSIMCCALSKKEFNRVSACKSAMEMWEKLRITYEGTDKVKETRIDILVTQYERFQMQSGSLMAHEINMERLGESSSRKKQSNALKANEDISEESLDNSESIKDSDDEEAMLSRRLQRILVKKKKFHVGKSFPDVQSPLQSL
ncbi:hypothetical protein Taro_010591 [Colocasia esculenta]|uniref:Gag-pol polyprotein n=1 Tax=Colocasia esculenta TaxID=4460 RepID=A0A843U8P7_COLES|nr:hypothetical protein [Colocasia esculenta]